MVGTITLGRVLAFATGMEEEPVLGYDFHPSINFVPPNVGSYIPTSNVCIGRINLPTRQTQTDQLPKDMATVFDYAFSNQYFGIK